MAWEYLDPTIAVAKIVTDLTGHVVKAVELYRDNKLEEAEAELEQLKKKVEQINAFVTEDLLPELRSETERADFWYNQAQQLMPKEE